MQTIENQLFDHISGAVCQICQIAGNRTKSRNGIAYVSMAAVLGGVQVMAAAMGKAPKGDNSEEERNAKNFDPSTRVHDDSVLFCLLVCAGATTIEHTGERDTLRVETHMHPRAYAFAADAFEKITGRKPDPYVCKEVLQDGRENSMQESALAQQADDLLTRLMGARPINDKPI